MALAVPMASAGALAANAPILSTAPSCTRESTAELARSTIRGATGRRPEPGVTLAVFYPTRWHVPVVIAEGFADYERRTPLSPDARMPAGSIGKTFFAAAALHLAESGRLDLDRPITAYLHGLDVPNGGLVTTRMLLSHTSGYGEYDGEFMQALIAGPLRERTMEDWLGPLRRQAQAEPGTFRYSDLNFVLLAAIVSRVSGRAWDRYIEEQFLRPFGLRDTQAALSPRIANLTPGYAGAENFFGRDAMMEGGSLIYNPQFESGGGGYVSSASDLARWIVRFAAANAVSPETWAMAATPTHPADEHGNTYGLGIHIDATPLGTAFGHSGYIPGYVSWVRYYERAGIAIAIQVNTSDQARLPWDGYDLMNAIAIRLAADCS